MPPLSLPLPLLLLSLSVLSQAQPHRILSIAGGDVCFRLQLTSAPSSYHCALVERWDSNNAPSAVTTIGQPRLHVEHDPTPTATPAAAPTAAAPIAAPTASFVSTACCVVAPHRPTVVTVVLIVDRGVDDDAQQRATGTILATATVLVLHGGRAALPPSAKLNLGAGSDLIHADSSGDGGSAWLNFDGLFYSNDADASNQGRDDWATDAASARAAAASKSPNLVVRWEWRDGLAFLPDASIRIITVSHALMYAGFNDRRQWEDFFRECRRILEPFGVIRITGDDHRRQVL